MSDFVASQAAERHPPLVFLRSWPSRLYSMFYGMFGCPPGAVGARKFARLCPPVAPCGGLWLAVETDWMPL